MSKTRGDISFKTPTISKLNFSINENYDDNFSGNIKINLSTNIKVAEKNEEEEIYFSKLIIKTDSELESIPFNFLLEIEGLFYRERISDIDMETFAKRNTIAILYSYARPIISDIVAKSGFPPYNIPFMNFSELDLNEDDD